LKYLEDKQTQKTESKHHADQDDVDACEEELISLKEKASWKDVVSDHSCSN